MSMGSQIKFYFIWADFSSRYSTHLGTYFGDFYKNLKFCPSQGVPALCTGPGRVKMVENHRNKRFSLFLTHFSRFLPQIICFYVTSTCKQYFFTCLRVPKGRRGQKWSFSLQNSSKSIKIIKHAHF